MFLIERGFSRQTISTYDLRFCVNPDSEYSGVTNRIVAPIVMNCTLVGWQARFVGDPPGPHCPKYYTCPRMRTGEVLYNYDTAKHKEFVILCEGITDVWRIGGYGVALLGKSMSMQQRQLIRSTWSGKPVVVLLDADACEEAQRLGSSLRSIHNAPVVVVALPPGSDPADLPRFRVSQIIREQAAEIGVRLPSL
jgi:DNA primase